MQKFVKKSKYFHFYITLYVVVTNRQQYITNSNIHCRNTRQGSNIHQTVSKFSVYQRGSYQMELKVFNSLGLKVFN